jgi:uncharacterized protein YqgV (UPF0045/DUF77 family)
VDRLPLENNIVFPLSLDVVRHGCATQVFKSSPSFGSGPPSTRSRIPWLLLLRVKKTKILELCNTIHSVPHGDENLSLVIAKLEDCQLLLSASSLSTSEDSDLTILEGEFFEFFRIIEEIRIWHLNNVIQPTEYFEVTQRRFANYFTLSEESN